MIEEFEYEIPRAFELITRYFKHKYYQCPRDVLSMLESTDPDAGLIAAVNKDDANEAFESCIRRGASTDAQHVALLVLPVESAEDFFDKCPVIRDDDQKRRLFRLFYLWLKCKNAYFCAHSESYWRLIKQGRPYDPRLKHLVLDALRQEGSLRYADILQYTLEFDDDLACTEVLRAGVEPFELDRALMKAALLGKPDYVRVLLQHGADPDAKRAGPPNGICFRDDTPLSVACHFNDNSETDDRLDVVRLLCDSGADVKRNGTTALTRTFQTRDFDLRRILADTLIAAGADITNEGVQAMAYKTREGALYVLEKTKR